MAIATMSETSTFAQPLPTEIQNWGRARLADYFGDWVVYRDLEPLESRLPGLRSSAGKMGLPDQTIPRKKERNYAMAAVWLLNQAQKIRKVPTPIQEVLVIGDSLYNDGFAYRNIRELTQWRGSCFIGTEQSDETEAVKIDEDDGIYCANRWAALGAWTGWLRDQDFSLDQKTAVIVDIDKTALGALGRNDSVIDRTRLEGIYRTMSAVLGSNYDEAAFETQYATLNSADFHCITADNQDYLAYVCLVLNAKLIEMDELVTEVEQGHLDNFEQFTRWVGTRMMINPAGGEKMRQVHETVMASARVGDPTPFKRFRRQEFVATIERMGNLADDSTTTELLMQEITLTNEICELSEWLQERGCLMLCLSDKPSEASCPDSYESAQLPPVHEAETHKVGTTIQSILNGLK